MRLAGCVVAFTQAGSGPPLLLIHGLGGNRHTWRALLPRLARCPVPTQ
ncbi:hypothetical protein OK015_17245 [Mycobacterium sp. Aquia_216]|nr:hypothetical protein [Mycobacterium sp. Aquia_216]WAJ42990.1 hypothetical protein OK015_17245 [Mycobacterium sp. Aquia_216]